MSKLFKEILCYFGLVIFEISLEFIFYNGNINFKLHITIAIIVLIVGIIIKIIYTIIKKRKNERKE